MKDTSDAMERGYREMLLKRSGEERLKMGCSMHATAQALVRALALAENPFASPSALKKVLFLRFYGQDFNSAVRKRILRALAKALSGAGSSVVATSICHVNSNAIMSG
ncbi:MAG: hypothetical protein EXR70_23870 [Deltaproteobacteria bacterium]|nr:hypothetical protein [Deltaproteobacteria bacterium]